MGKLEAKLLIPRLEKLLTTARGTMAQARSEDEDGRRHSVRSPRTMRSHDGGHRSDGERWHSARRPMKGDPAQNPTLNKGSAEVN